MKSHWDSFTLKSVNFAYMLKIGTNIYILLSRKLELFNELKMLAFDISLCVGCVHTLITQIIDVDNACDK